MKNEFWAIIAVSAVSLTLSSCESPEEKAKRLACEELMSLNITALQYDSQLVAEAAKGSVKRMQLLMTAGADVNTPDSKGKTALVAAVQSRNPDAVKLVLEAGAGVDVKNAIGETVLHIVAAENYANALPLLLEGGANVNEPDASGQTPLFFAIKKGNIDIARKLLEAGADVNTADTKGMTPLMVALNEGKKELVTALLEKGANVNAADDDGLNPIIIALEKRSVELCRILIEAGADVNAVGKSGVTPLHYAVVCGDANLVSLLLEKGADCNTMDVQGNTLLMHACMEGFPEIVDKLMDVIDVNAINKQGQTALHVAIAHVDVVQKLLKAGIDVNKADSQGYTPLMQAVKTRRLAAVKVLLDANADVTPICPGGMPLIALAAERGGEEMVKTLINSGVDATISFERNGKRVNALACADAENVRKLLKSAGCIDSISTDEAVELLERYEIINPYDSRDSRSRRFLYNYKLFKDGRKALSDYAYVDDIYWGAFDRSKYLPLECIAAFISAGTGLDGMELYYASSRGQTEIVKLLLAVPGIDVNIGEPLVDAASRGHTEIVKLLLAAPGIDVNKDSPLRSAASQGHSEIVELLKAAGARE